MSKKEVANVEENQFPATRPDFMSDTARGQENVGMEDLTIPRLDVIQDLSPQHKENKPEYIEGAKPGLLFNSVSGRLYGDKVFFIPVYFRKEWIIWRHQNAGGGFKGAFGSLAEAQAEFNAEGYAGKTIKVNGSDVDEYEIVDTAQHFGLVLNGDQTMEDIVISMAKSKAKVSRSLNTQVKMNGGDRFSRVYEIKAIEDQNGAGQDYWNLNIKGLGFVSEEMYHRAEALYEAISSGQRDVKREEAEAEAKEKADYEVQ